MAVLLEALLPRVLPDLRFLCLPHEGKKDLEASIPRKLRAWKEPGVHFVVVHDNDGADCVALKERLQRRCAEGRRADTLVRIACQELEAWYLGDGPALADAYGRAALADLGAKRGFRDPDAVQRPSEQVSNLVPEFQKISGARLMGARLSEETNSSTSFRTFMTGVRRLAASLPPAGQA